MERPSLRNARTSSEGKTRTELYENTRIYETYKVNRNDPHLSFADISTYIHVRIENIQRECLIRPQRVIDVTLATNFSTPPTRRERVKSTTSRTYSR